MGLVGWLDGWGGSSVCVLRDDIIATAIINMVI